MLRRRVGRPGLLGTMARTAVIAGTANVVSDRMAQSQQRRAEAAAPPPATPPAAAVPGPPASGQLLDQLERLAGMRADGMLDDAEYARAKALLLSP